VSEIHQKKCVVCDYQVDNAGGSVEFGDKQLTVCSNECADKFKENPLKYLKAALISIILGLTVNPAIAASADEAYQMINAEKRHLMSRYDATAREFDQLEKQIAALRHDTSQEAGRAEGELDKELSYKSRELKQIEFQIRDLDQALKAI
jgi:YHS domain-containing protein